MIALIWNTSTAIRRYLRTYMPTNIAIDGLRTCRGLKWAAPVAILAVSAYLISAAMVSSAVSHGAPGLLNVLVLLFAWDAMKFAWAGVFSAVRVASGALRQQRRTVGHGASDVT